MTQHVLIVKSAADGLTYLSQINLGQTSLWSETANIDHLNATEFIVGAYKFDKTIWLDQETDRWELELIHLAERWCTLDHTACLAELSHVLIPATVV